MKTLAVSLLALCVAGASAAHAQSAFYSNAMALTKDCIAADTKGAASAALVTCEKLITDVEALRASSGALTANDQNVYFIVKALGELRVGGAYGSLDGVRSARVCQRTERSWALLTQINKAESPGMAASIDSMRSSTASTIAVCRREFGTPAGAPALP